MNFRDNNYWALILGGSSGFGLATAHKLAKHGMNLCIVHRDRRASMERINGEFEALRANGIQLVTMNTDALSPEGRAGVLDQLGESLRESGGSLRLLMHSIAFGNLKLLTPQDKAPAPAGGAASNGHHDSNGSGGVAVAARPKAGAAALLAERLGVSEELLRDQCNALFEEGHSEFMHVADEPAYNQELFLEEEDFAATIFAMGTSLAAYVREISARELFAADARVIGMTSQGNEVAWRGYAAVSAAKVALESVSRSIAVEYAPRLRSNIVQAGVTDTPALRLIPGSRHIVAAKQLTPPMGRITTPADVAGVIALLCTDEAAWINGEIIRVDGGERIAG